jgi:hypothetical protein
MYEYSYHSKSAIGEIRAQEIFISHAFLLVPQGMSIKYVPMF